MLRIGGFQSAEQMAQIVDLALPKGQDTSATFGSECDIGVATVCCVGLSLDVPGLLEPRDQVICTGYGHAQFAAGLRDVHDVSFVEQGEDAHLAWRNGRCLPLHRTAEIDDSQYFLQTKVGAIFERLLHFVLFIHLKHRARPLVYTHIVFVCIPNCEGTISFPHRNPGWKTKDRGWSRWAFPRLPSRICQPNR